MGLTDIIVAPRLRHYTKRPRKVTPGKTDMRATHYTMTSYICYMYIYAIVSNDYG